MEKYELGNKKYRIEPKVIVNRETFYQIKKSARQGKGFFIMGTNGVYIEGEDKVELTLELELEW